MKIPCEIVVWNVLPLIRRELASELVSAHGFTQAQVARKFGLTDAAVSQYMSGKRGGEYGGSAHYPGFMEEIRASAARIAEDADVGTEICMLCGYVKGTGFLAEIYRSQTGRNPPGCIFGLGPE